MHAIEPPSRARATESQSDSESLQLSRPLVLLLPVKDRSDEKNKYRTLSMKTKNIRCFLMVSSLLLLSMATPAQAATYAEGAVTDGGSISGKLSYDGALPEDAVERITISKNPDVCDDEGTG